VQQTVQQPDDLVYDPFDEAINDDPYPVYARMREEAPLYWNEKFQFYALTRYEDVLAGLLAPDAYRSGHGTMFELLDAPQELVPNWLLFKDPPEHTRLRALVSRAFTPRRVAELEPRIREIAGGLLDRYTAGDTFDFVSDYGRQVPMRVIGSLIGVPHEDLDHVQSLFAAFAEMQADDQGFDFTKLLAITDYFRAMAEDRRAHPRDDMMTDLVQAEIPDESGERHTLSFEEIGEFVVLIDGAGTDTVSLLLGNAARLLAEHPDQRALLAADPARIPAAVEEIVRFDPPSPVQGRLTARDTEWYGHTVPAGTKLLLLNGASSRDPREYDDPDRFDVTRPIERHLSFGFGIHYCLGAALARLEARLALETALARFPEWETHPEQAVRFRTTSVRGYRHFPVTV
jgi:cytochrome P450